MDYIGFGTKKLVGEFVYAYVGKAFELAKKEPTLEKFDSSLFENIAKECNLEKKVIVGLHHPFHWAFFNSINGSSPFEIIYPKKLGDFSIVRLKNKSYDDGDVLSMANRIIDNYGNILIEKKKNLTQ